MYHIRLKSDDTWDIEAPDGTAIDSDKTMPPNLLDSTVWKAIWTHAITNDQPFEAVVTVRASGSEIIIDERQ